MTKNATFEALQNELGFQLKHQSFDQEIDEHNI